MLSYYWQISAILQITQCFQGLHAKCMRPVAHRLHYKTGQ